jgi:hypothetical protein
MDLNGQVGETAGEVWRAFHESGPRTLAQLKKGLNGNSVLLKALRQRVRSRASRR